MNPPGGLSDATPAPAPFAKRISTATPLAMAAADLHPLGGDDGESGGRPRVLPSDYAGRDGGFELSGPSGSDWMVFNLQAASVGIDLSGWDADWRAADLFIAGLDDERCASFGGAW
ncbi:MAG: hypothetical protein WA085_05240 [Sphingobium sp.]|uniref:hypothetical protein n=1 Tax=Sphingobium sp. CECT 9361 TaxID=2845384 RepID=UPI001E389D66|nr:hypothetical protein [Sphingobium sp. CECT 9361]CAH0348272.1 hypothetical protein SPH9361_00016 [Sphingobium sp. CECT 9361]